MGVQDRARSTSRGQSPVPSASRRQSPHLTLDPLGDRQSPHSFADACQDAQWSFRAQCAAGAQPIASVPICLSSAQSSTTLPPKERRAPAFPREDAGASARVVQAASNRRYSPIARTASSQEDVEATRTAFGSALNPKAVPTDVCWTPPALADWRGMTPVGTTPVGTARSLSNHRGSLTAPPSTAMASCVPLSRPRSLDRTLVDGVEQPVGARMVEATARLDRLESTHICQQQPSVSVPINRSYSCSTTVDRNATYLDSGQLTSQLGKSSSTGMLGRRCVMSARVRQSSPMATSPRLSPRLARLMAHTSPRRGTSPVQRTLSPIGSGRSIVAPPGQRTLSPIGFGRSVVAPPGTGFQLSSPLSGPPVSSPCISAQTKVPVPVPVLVSQRRRPRVAGAEMSPTS